MTPPLQLPDGPFQHGQAGHAQKGAGQVRRRQLHQRHGSGGAPPSEVTSAVDTTAARAPGRAAGAVYTPPAHATPEHVRPPGRVRSRRAAQAAGVQPPAAVGRRGDLRRDRGRHVPRRSAVPGRRRSQAAGHLPPVSGGRSVAGRRTCPRGAPAGAAGGAGTAALLWRLAAGWPGEGGGGAGAVAAGLFLVFSTTWHDYDALAANCELFLLLPQTAAALLLLRAVERPPAALRLLPAPGHRDAGGVVRPVQVPGSDLPGGVGRPARVDGAERARRRVWRGPGAAGPGGGRRAPGGAVPRLGGRSRSASATVRWFAFNFSYVGAGLEGTQALRRGCGGAADRRRGHRALRAGPAGSRGDLAAALRARGGHRKARPGTPGAAGHAVVARPRWVAVATGGRFFGHYFHLLLRPCACWRPRRSWPSGGGAAPGGRPLRACARCRRSASSCWPPGRGHWPKLGSPQSPVRSWWPTASSP